MESLPSKAPLIADNTLLLISWLPFLLLPLLLMPLLNKLITNKPQKHFPPSPPKLPIIGNLHQLAQSGSSTHQTLWRMSQKYGAVMLLHLGRAPVLVISSAEAAKQAFKDNDLNCCSRPISTGTRRFTYNYQDITFCPHGVYWKEMRKKSVLELFSVNRVQSYRSIREEEAAEMINSISDHCASSNNSCVDLTDKLFAFTASIIFRTFFGTRFQGSYFGHERFHRAMNDIEASLNSFYAVDYFPSYIGSIIDRITGKAQELDRVFREVHGFFQQVIDDHLRPERTKPEHEDIVDVLLKIVEQTEFIGATQLGHNSIKAVLLDLFVGGIDTSSITMVWAMAELVKNPRVMKKAQEEVRNCIENRGKVSETDLEQLGYLKMIVKETLRLHPPAPLLLPRETISHFKVLGYDVDPKTIVYVNDWAISRDPEFWKDPEDFIPERFDDISVDFKGQHFVYLPFGAGRRICPAIYMATMTVELALANLLYCFDWKVPNEMKEEDINMEEKVGALATSLKAPLKLVAVRHLASEPAETYQGPVHELKIRPCNL